MPDDQHGDREQRSASADSSARASSGAASAPAPMRRARRSTGAAVSVSIAVALTLAVTPAWRARRRTSCRRTSAKSGSCRICFSSQHVLGVGLRLLDLGRAELPGQLDVRHRRRRSPRSSGRASPPPSRPSRPDCSWRTPTPGGGSRGSPSPAPACSASVSRCAPKIMFSAPIAVLYGIFDELADAGRRGSRPGRARRRHRRRCRRARARGASR